MDTVLDKSWIDALATKAQNRKGDFAYNSLQGIIQKQKTNPANNDETTEVNEIFNDKKNEIPVQSFFLPDLPPPYLISETKSYFTGAQKWIGHVTEIKKHTFKAQLIDLNKTTTYEIGEFELNEVPPEDKELLSIGAAFYWSIGQANINGQIEKKSLIRFQRMKPWSANDYDNALDRANKLFHELNW